MSERLPLKEEALQFLYQTGCSRNVINHCEAVTELALEIATLCKKREVDVDVELVEIGALLHDIGRSKTHSVHHAVIGAEIAKSLGLPKSVISIIKRHVGGGIPPREARRLGWPKDTYTPQTIEEKIVCYADKLVEGTKRVSIERTIERFSKELPVSAVEGIRRLRMEMMDIIGDCDCIL